MRAMTGYAQVNRREGSRSVQVLLRANNYKYLDITVRHLPREDIVLEEEIKRVVKAKVSRGKVEVHVFLRRPSEGRVYINERLFAEYYKKLTSVSRKYHLKGELRPSDIVCLPQVVCWEETSRSCDSLILPAVKEGVRKLVDFREKEGKAIKRHIGKSLRRLKANVARISRQKPAAGKENNRDDIDEEISLISFYLNKIEKVVYSPRSEPCGKTLDFLVQEVLRELNASSSKTKKKSLGALIVESKNYLERIREQAQNVE